MASGIFFIDAKGKVLLSRNYRADVSMSVAEHFTRRVLTDDENDMKPVFQEGPYTYVYIKYNSLYIMAVTNKNANVMVILNFLYLVVSVLKDYFNELEEESIKDNFVIIYELLDEMMDFGYPQATNTKTLKTFIQAGEAHKVEKKKLAENVTGMLTGATPWRAEGIKHKKNEIFLDVIEKLNLLVASNGTVLHSEIMGTVKMKSYLSGMPELKLGLNDKILMQNRGRTRGKSVEMDDIRFHQCVRLSRFESNRTISFIPPDGPFDFMQYRLTTKVRPLIWIEAQVESHKSSRVEFLVKAKSNFKRRSNANNVEIIVAVPEDADSPSFKTSVGKVEYTPEESCFKWKIKQFPGQKQYMMRAHFGLPSIQSEESEAALKKPINVKFEIPYFTVSGIQVRYLKITEKSGYHALPWVRYITQNGDYQVRMQ
mmetsp:Transcript_6604/g.10901  ORF Transcript_6604/g.10901 Transcript_6604/m.10901 type:complete len:427 (-) Transcript_6604:268-1548(-)|eukprot:jgi/Bigna1/47664/estExt_Genewise1.C_170012